MENYKSVEHKSWGRPEIIVIKALNTEAQRTSAASAGLPGVASRETETTLARSSSPRPKLGHDHQQARSCLQPSTFSSKSCSISEGKQMQATTCRRAPNSSAALRPCGARGRPAVDVSHVDLKPAQRQGPRGRVRAPGSASTAAPSHVVSIATAAPAAEPFPEDPQGQRSSLWQQKLLALWRLRLAASAAMRRVSPGSPGPVAFVVASPGCSGCGSYSKEDRASPWWSLSSGSS